MLKEAEAKRINRQNEKEAKETVRARFRKIIAECRKEGDVLVRTPGVSEKSKRKLELLGYCCVYSVCSYEKMAVKTEKYDVASGYSGTISENGTVNLSREYKTVTSSEIGESDVPGVYGEKRYMKVCKKGTGDTTYSRESSILQEDLETFCQIRSQSTLEGKLNFGITVLFNVLLFLSTISTLIYYAISSCGQFLDHFIFKFLSRGAIDEIGYSPIRFLFAATAVLFSIIAGVIWSKRIESFDKKDKDYSNFLDKFPIDACYLSAGLTVLAFVFDLLNIWLLRGNGNFLLIILKLLVILVGIIRIFLALMAIAIALGALIFLIGNITYIRLSRSLNKRKDMIMNGSFDSIGRTLDEIIKCTENSILKKHFDDKINSTHKEDCKIKGDYAD